jgi:FMN-dependent oxidoreductase (nitrilotriacetate monooxygenase family)
MHLALLLDGTGTHVSGWRAPGAVFGPEDFSLMARCTHIAEQAKFDMVFLADAPVFFPGPSFMMRFEAMSLIAGLSAVTTHIGLAASVSTTYSQPYNVARMFSSIDHMSGGRAGWNVVTTSNPEAAKNFGEAEHAAKADRYEMAGEYVDVVKGLWDSWEDDAVVADLATGQLVDMDKRHTLNHVGKHFAVKGPLNSSRAPQGHPVILQAGASELGLPFAAATGEVIFAVQQNMELGVAFRSQLRALAAKAGRNPDHMRVLPGLCPIVAESEAKAKEMLADMAQFIDAEAAWAKLGLRMGVDLTGVDPEGPMPEIPAAEMRSYAKVMLEVSAKYNFNLRQLSEYFAAAEGFKIVLGTPEMIADEMELWFTSEAADGFVIIPPWLLSPLEAFAGQVVPILQKRGLFRTDYTGRTLREHLGLPRPAHPAAKSPVAAH